MFFKMILSISLLINVIAISKWIFWSRAFIGAFYMYQEKHGKLSEDELKKAMEKAINYGIKHTVNDLSSKN